MLASEKTALLSLLFSVSALFNAATENEGKVHYSKRNDHDNIYSSFERSGTQGFFGYDLTDSMRPYRNLCGTRGG